MPGELFCQEDEVLATAEGAADKLIRLLSDHKPLFGQQRYAGAAGDEAGHVTQWAGADGHSFGGVFEEQSSHRFRLPPGPWVSVRSRRGKSFVHHSSDGGGQG